MNRENLLIEIERFMIKIKKDYQDNIITKDKYVLMYFELGQLIESLCNTDLLLLTTKFHTIKTIYLIMK